MAAAARQQASQEEEQPRSNTRIGNTKYPRRVFIVACAGSQYHAMFNKNDEWEIVDKLEDAEMVQFTGGSDVNPYLYNQYPHDQTHYHADRDRIEGGIFRYCIENHVYMAGICRGAQFLNIMCGGDMYQHVDNHRVPDHEVEDLLTGELYRTTSTHHQMMIPGQRALVVAIARESRQREKVYKVGHKICDQRGTDGVDYETIYYPGPRALCFQGHPEYTGVPNLADVYFEYLDEYVFTDGWEMCKDLT